MRPGIGRNASCALGDCLPSRPKGRSWPRELWFSIYSCIQGVCSTVCAHVHVHTHMFHSSLSAPWVAQDGTLRTWNWREGRELDTHHCSAGEVRVCD